MTDLSGRQILMVVLCFLIFMGGMMGTVFIMIPSTNDPVGSRNVAVVSILIAVLSTIWFVKLCVDAIRDRRRGVVREAAKVGGRFHVWFGLAVAVGGIACSWLTLDTARMAGGGVWTFYYGMIGWGVLQAISAGPCSIASAATREGRAGDSDIIVPPWPPPPRSRTADRSASIRSMPRWPRPSVSPPPSAMDA